MCNMTIEYSEEIDVKIIKLRRNVMRTWIVCAVLSTTSRQQCLWPIARHSSRSLPLAAVWEHTGITILSTVTHLERN